jgi:hypothetical protein
MPIIRDPRERVARQLEKRRLLLRFLREEIHTCPKIAGVAAGLNDPRSVSKLVHELEADGFVAVHKINVLGQASVTVLGITNTGQYEAADLDKGEAINPKYFEPGRVSPLFLQHVWDVQLARLTAERAGCKRWINGDRLAKWKKGVKRPDAIVLTASDQAVAIEVERTPKSLKRYERTWGEHLEAIQQNKWHRIVYACPTVRLAKAVENVIRGIGVVTIAGQKIKVDAGHQMLVKFVAYEHLAEALG